MSRSNSPFVLSLSKHAHAALSPFDRLRANGSVAGDS